MAQVRACLCERFQLVERGLAERVLGGGGAVRRQRGSSGGSGERRQQAPPAQRGERRRAGVVRCGGQRLVRGAARCSTARAARGATRRRALPTRCWRSRGRAIPAARVADCARRLSGAGAQRRAAAVLHHVTRVCVCSTHARQARAAACKQQVRMRVAVSQPEWVAPAADVSPQRSRWRQFKWCLKARTRPACAQEPGDGRARREILGAMAANESAQRESMGTNAFFCEGTLDRPRARRRPFRLPRGGAARLLLSPWGACASRLAVRVRCLCRCVGAPACASLRASAGFRAPPLTRAVAPRSKTRGLGAGRKLKTRRREQRWHDKEYCRSNLGSEWKKPFAGTSHSKGIVLEKMCVSRATGRTAVAAARRERCRCRSLP
jgi:small subunit ribosomal protein S23e